MGIEMRKKYFLFDLDGTLTDPKLGITTCVQYALAAFGIEEPNRDKLEPFIGPPLADSFMEFYGFDRDRAQAAVKKYQERFRTVGLYENEVYAGIPELLEKLGAQGALLAVASSKPQVFVEQILEHFHLRQYFHVVVGSELDGRRGNKDEVVREALGQLLEKTWGTTLGKGPGGDAGENLGAEAQGEFSEEFLARVFMIGDRKFDVEGAAALSVESVGVTYGYGDREELTVAGADYIVDSVAELEHFLLSGGKEEK